MSAWRYWIGVLFVITLPPAIVWWFIIHPFVEFWRRLGVRLTLSLMVLFLLATVFGLFRIKDVLLGPDLGTQPVLLVVAVGFLVASLGLRVAWQKHLTTPILAGVPELRPDGAGGSLLDQGIYAKVRHPRYVEVILGGFAVAAFSNFVGVYVVALLSIPAIHAIVLLEERELLERFGSDYRDYMGRVPRYIPRFRTAIAPEQGP